MKRTLEERVRTGSLSPCCPSLRELEKLFQVVVVLQRGRQDLREAMPVGQDQAVQILPWILS